MTKTTANQTLAQRKQTQNVAKAKKRAALSAMDPVLDLAEAIPCMREGIQDILEQLLAFQAYLDAASVSVRARGARTRLQAV